MINPGKRKGQKALYNKGIFFHAKDYLTNDLINSIFFVLRLKT